MLHLAQHGEADADLPATGGVVRRVRMTSTLYEEVPPGSRSWEPVRPPDVRHRDLDRALRWFGQVDADTGPRRVDDALLVDLEVRHLS